MRLGRGSKGWVERWGHLVEEFVSCFAEVADPRRGNARHNLHEMLLIALCAMLCGGEDCSDMELFGQAKEVFLRRFLRLRHGIPSHDTFSRVLRLLDPAAFEACFIRFMRRFAEGLQGVSSSKSAADDGIITWRPGLRCRVVALSRSGSA